jgi:hypothetical protein
LHEVHVTVFEAKVHVAQLALAVAALHAVHVVAEAK